MCRSRPGLYSLPQGCDSDASGATLGSTFLFYVAHTGLGQPGNERITDTFEFVCLYTLEKAITLGNNMLLSGMTCFFQNV